ncbi:MAG: AI-2E family transporter [Candidatus Andersenbacteria bacterium]
MSSEKQVIEISSNTLIRIILFAVLLFVGYLVRDILLMLVGAMVIAFAIEPMAKALQKYNVPRAISVVVVYFAFIGLIALAVTLVLPALANQTVQIAGQVPQIVQGAEHYIGTIPGFSPEAVTLQLQQALRSFSSNLSNLSSQVFTQTKSIFTGVFSMFFVLVIALYLVIEEDAIKKLFRYIIPKQHVAYAEFMIDRIQEKLGRWVLAQMFLGVLIGVVTGVIFWVLGFKYALAMGMVAGILEIFPVVGPILSGIFGVALGLSQSFILGIIALVVYVVVQQTEAQVIIPNLMRKAVGLNPLVTIIAVLLGGRLAGVPGIILAVPVATMLSIVLGDFFSTAAGDEELAG